MKRLGYDRFLEILVNHREGFLVTAEGEIRCLDKCQLHGYDHPYPCCPIIRVAGILQAPISRMFLHNANAWSVGRSIGMADATVTRIVEAADAILRPGGRLKRPRERRDLLLALGLTEVLTCA